MYKIHIAFASLLAYFVLAGCAPLHEIRTGDTVFIEHESAEIKGEKFPCNTGKSDPHLENSAYERHAGYELSFIEYDDQGWFHSMNRRQLNLLEKNLREDLSKFPDEDLDVVVFVHGWHHNAYDNDCNVLEFRSMLNNIASKYSGLNLNPRRRLIGVYVAWRGDSLALGPINMVTILDRRNAAEHVAKGEVRDLFAVLRKYSMSLNSPDVKEGPSSHTGKMRSMVIGHSFGGLIAFHSLSQALLNDIEMQRLKCENKDADPAQTSWPNLLVLINPAFEASRFEAFHKATEPIKDCGNFAPTKPRLVVVTADNDTATGPVFTAGRKVLTIFEKYSPDNPQLKEAERESNTHTIGFVPRYRTHRICNGNSAEDAYISFSPNVAPSQVDQRSPVWVIGAPPTIVNNHDGFLYARRTLEEKVDQPVLLNWIVKLYLSENKGSENWNQGIVKDDPKCGEWPKR